LSPEYFRHVFAEASPPYPSLAALVRADGEILARQPQRPDYPRLAPDSALRRAIKEHPEAGTYVSVSSFNGQPQISAYRKVGAYPVYVWFGVEQQVLLRRWYHNLLIYGASAAGASAVLLLVSWLALSRARAEESALLQLRSETEQRLLAEERLRHAQRLEALGQLAGGIAHDFNNVLQAMTGGATLIESRADDPQAVRRFARMVLDAGRRGASVTGRLLAFARRSDLRAEPVDVAALFSGLREIFSHALGAGIEVVVDVASDVPALLADLGQLETVLVNLATNARDAMPTGGRLTLAADVVALSGEHEYGVPLQPGRYVRLFITDTGTGMDAATLARASEPFFTTKRRGQGTGLGLAMARGFAEQSGGALQIESKPGHGTTVTLWLPKAAGQTSQAETVERESIQRARRTDAQRPRVLLVGDQMRDYETTSKQLADAGYDVLTRSGGAEALALLQQKRVDVLVTDLSMPGIDGLALIRAAQEQAPGLPAILLTGYSGEGTALALGNTVSGTFTLLRKPLQRTELADRIAMLLTVASEDAG
jgi:signal transduction histidine kinase